MRGENGMMPVAREREGERGEGERRRHTARRCGGDDVAGEEQGERGRGREGEGERGVWECVLCVVRVISVNKSVSSAILRFFWGMCDVSIRL